MSYKRMRSGLVLGDGFPPGIDLKEPSRYSRIDKERLLAAEQQISIKCKYDNHVKSLRIIWGLTFNSHCFSCPLLRRCLRLFDEICRRFLNVIKMCIPIASSLVRGITNYGINYGRRNSLLGHNLLFCAQVVLKQLLVVRLIALLITIRLS